MSAGDLVVEIGPGRGVLTRQLSRRGVRVVAVELDEELTGDLDAEFADEPGVTVVGADARTVDLGWIVPEGVPYKVVANLPYYAATTIIRRLLSGSHRPESMVVMLQREVAQSMAAAPGKMSTLSVMVQLFGKVKIVGRVPPSAFRPPPKVTSSIVRIDVLPEPALALDSHERFFDHVKAAFTAPRKQIHNSLKQRMAEPEAVDAALSRAGIDPTRRPATLTMAEWGALYDAFRAVPAELLGP